MNIISKNITLVFSFFISLCITFIFRDEVFLWDNITTTSGTASFLYFHGWHIFSMGNYLDCGHPPLMSLYYALSWKLFGRNLLVSHFAQMPFLWLFLHQYFLLAKKMFEKEKSNLLIFLSTILLFADTTFLSQAAQVGFEISLVSFFLLAVNLLWKRLSGESNNVYIFLLCLIIMPLMQLRGVPIVISLFIIEAIFTPNFFKRGIKNVFITLLPYSISALILCSWLWLHFTHVGYLITDPKSSWGADNNSIADFHRIIFNSLIIGLRWIDNGRILLCLILVFASFWFLFKQKEKSFSKFIFVVWLITSIVLSLNFVMMTKPICHRYLLPAIVMMPLLAIYFIFHQTFFNKKSIQISVVFILIAGAIAGNFYFYLERYSIGWDSTLAHLPYKDLRKDVEQFAVENKIPADKCGSRFPLDVPDSIVYLTAKNPSWTASSMNASNLEIFDYVLFSNICTSFTDEQKQILNKKYGAIKKWRKGKVVFIFYKKLKPNSTNANS